MGGGWRQSPLTGIGVLFGVTLAGLLLLPFFALAISTPASDLLEGATHPLFASALFLSLRTLADKPIAHRCFRNSSSLVAGLL